MRSHHHRVSPAYVRQKCRIGIPMLLYMIIYLMFFRLLETMPRSSWHIIHMRLDDIIPFCEVFIIPYYLWFGFVFLVEFSLFMWDESTFVKTSFALCIGMTIFLIVSYVYPNRLMLRPSVMPRHNIFTAIVAFLYRGDTPTNVWPSMHVYNTIICLVGIYESSLDMFRKKIARIFYTILSVLIILATVFLKQHSVWDVIGAAAMSLPTTLLCFRSSGEPSLTPSPEKAGATDSAA